MNTYILDLPLAEEPIYINTDDEIFVNLIFEAYVPFVKASRESLDVRNNKKYLVVRKTNDQRLVSSHDRREGILVKPERLSHILFLFLSRNLILNRGGYFIHGAVVAKGEQGIVLTGESGSGKSTLCSFLQLSNDMIACVTDDKVIIDCSSMQLFPCGDGIHLREGSMEILKKYYGKFETEAVELYNYKRAKINSEKNGTLKLLTVIQLDRNENDNYIEELDTNNAIRVLLMNSFVSSNIKSNFQSAVDLCRKIDVYKLSYSDMAQVKQYIMNLFEKREDK